MKYIILFLFILTLLGGSSCKKSYTCYCSNYSVTPTYDTSFTIEAVNASKAVDNCYSQTLGHTATCVYQ